MPTLKLCPQTGQRARIVNGVLTFCVHWFTQCSRATIVLVSAAPRPTLREENMKRMTKGKFVPVLLTAALGIGLVACGGDDSSTSTAAPAGSEAPASSDAPAGTDAPMGTDAPAEGATLANFTAWADLPAEAGGLDASPVVDCAPADGPLKAADLRRTDRRRWMDSSSRRSSPCCARALR